VTDDGIEGQEQYLQRIGRALVSDIPSDCERIVMHLRSTAVFGQSTTNAFRADGSEVHLSVNIDASEAADELREAMARPGRGTWFSARFTVTNTGSMDADFDYHSEPDWAHPVDPVIYVNDLKEYPRDEANMPEWLKRDVAASARGVTAVGGRR
jgi:hypothetical protein